MEGYVECLVLHKESGLNKALAYLLGGIAVLDFLFGFMTKLIFVVPGLALGALAFYFYQNMVVEYEYLYAEKEISVDIIRNYNSRKHVADFKVEEMEILARSNSWRLGEYKNGDFKVRDFSSCIHTSPDEKFVMVMGNKEKIILTPTAAFLEAVYNVAPRKVFTKD